METEKTRPKVLSGCCVSSGNEESDVSAEPLAGWQRKARSRTGFLFLAGGALLCLGACLLTVLLWPLAALAAWFGISHLAAGRTGYRGCPELGAIPSLILGRHVETRCAPWDRIDRRIDTGG